MHKKLTKIFCNLCLLTIGALTCSGAALASSSSEPVSLENEESNLNSVNRAASTSVALYKVTPQGSIVINRIPINNTNDSSAAMKKCNELKVDMETRENSSATYVCRNESN